MAGTNELEETKDITQLLEDVALLLTFESPMLHAQSFTLQDSMAALEIMDKKMDCCEVRSRKETKALDDDEKLIFPRPIPTGLEDEVDPLPWEELTLEDAAFVSMENLVRLESFLTEGSSIVESTYTSLYAHIGVMQDMRDRLEPTSLTEHMQAMMSSSSNPTKGTLAQHIVYSSTLMMIQLTELVRGVILNADIYEEEDFTVSTYSIKIYNDRDDASVVKVGRTVLEMIEKETEQSSSALKSSKLILEFQLDFINVITSLAGLSGRASIPEELTKSQVIAKGAVAKASEISKLIAELKPIQTEASKIVLKRSFDSNVNRPLVGNAPLRKIEFQEPDASLATLQTIISELDEIFCNILLKANTLGRIRYMMKNTSATSASILTRSLLVLNLYFDEMIFGQYILIDLIVNHMKQVAGVSDDVFLGNSGALAFLKRLCKPIYDTLKVLALSKNRQRSYIDVMLGDWSALREEAYMVDMTYHQESQTAQDLQPHFSLYVLSATIELMDLYVELGVELQLLCNEEELWVAFWYRDFLTSSLLSQMSTMRQGKKIAKQMAMAEQMKKQQQKTQNQSTNRSHKGGKKKGKNKKTSNNSNNADTVPTPMPTAEDIEDDLDFLLLNVKRSMCRGLVRFFAAVRQAGIVPGKEYEFTSNQRIFEKRFEIFSTVQQPPPLTYDDFRSGSDFSKVPQKDLLASTADSFRLSKSMIDRLISQSSLVHPNYLPTRQEELRQLAKVCLGNSIYLQKLIKEIEETGETKARVTIDTKTNKQFCTIKIE